MKSTFPIAALVIGTSLFFLFVSAVVGNLRQPPMKQIEDSPPQVSLVDDPTENLDTDQEVTIEKFDMNECEKWTADEQGTCTDPAMPQQCCFGG